MSNKENGSSPGSGGGNSSTLGQSNIGGASSEAHQYVGPYRLEKTLGKGQTGKSFIFDCFFPPCTYNFMDVRSMSNTFISLDC